MTLEGRNIAILIAPHGTEESEFVQPKHAIEQAGGTVTVVGLEEGEAKTNNGDLGPGGSYKVDRTVADVSADEFDCLIIPGGTVGADRLRADDEVVDFVSAFFQQKKPVGAICHGPWLLVEAGVVEDRELTSYSSIQTDIQNAGGNWTDQEVVVDEGLVTSRNPDDLPAFCARLVEEFAEGRHADA